MTIGVVLLEASEARAAELVRVLEAEQDITVSERCERTDDLCATVARVRPQVVVVTPGTGIGATLRAVEAVMAESPAPILALLPPGLDGQPDGAEEALTLGAVEVVPHRERWDGESAAALRGRVRILAGVAVVRRGPRRQRPASGAVAVDGGEVATGSEGAVIAIAASTGGPATLATVLRGLGDVAAPILLVQHLHQDFVQAFVSWMGRSSPLAVELATDGTAMRPGTVYVAPPGQHLKLGPGHRVELSSEPESLHRPSADELFRSVAAHAGRAGIGVVLTGIGDDGAEGLLALRQAGGVTIAQDEASSAVYGMPQAAERQGAVAHTLPVEEIARAIVRAVRKVGA